ncbi:unnamed protein product [Durusdinium trenchii]|uniref:Uncharacterized protein n=1 Tax=Durusdinium trenchii TaxID=1381693 RepID=A0ABP0PJ13_9DINO
MFPLVLRPVQKSASRLLLAGTHAAVEVTDHGTPLEVQQQPPVAVTWNGMTNDLQPRQMNVLAQPLWQGTARWPHAVENLLAQGSGGSQSSSLEQDESEAKAACRGKSVWRFWMCSPAVRARHLQDGQLSSETGAQCMWPVEAHAVFPPGACVWPAIFMTSDGCFSAGFPVAGVAHSDVTTQPPIQQQPAPSGEARLNTTQLPVEASSGSSSPRAVLRTAASRKQRRRLKAAAEGREDKEMPWGKPSRFAPTARSQCY